MTETLRDRLFPGGAVIPPPASYVGVSREASLTVGQPAGVLTPGQRRGEASSLRADGTRPAVNGPPAGRRGARLVESPAAIAGHVGSRTSGDSTAAASGTPAGQTAGDGRTTGNVPPILPRNAALTQRLDEVGGQAADLGPRRFVPRPDRGVRTVEHAPPVYLASGAATMQNDQTSAAGAGRYLATVWLFPSRHRDTITDPDQQRKLRAYPGPLTPLCRRFDHLARAEHWCKLVIGRKARSSRYYVVEEADVMVINRAWDSPRWTDEEWGRLQATDQTRRPVTVHVELPPELLGQLEAMATATGKSVGELLREAAVGQLLGWIAGTIR